MKLTKMHKWQRKSNPFAHRSINLWRLKHPKCWNCYYTQWKLNNFYKRMTSKNVWNSQSAQRTMNKKNPFAHKVINLWRLKTSQMLEILLYAMNSLYAMKEQSISSTDDVQKRMKLTKCTNSNEKAIPLLTGSSTYDVWKRPKYWKWYHTQ